MMSVLGSVNGCSTFFNSYARSGIQEYCQTSPYHNINHKIITVAFAPHMVQNVYPNRIDLPLREC